LTVVIFLIAYRIGQSPLGRVLKAIREDERAALAIGKNVVGFKVLVFMVAGALAAVAGSTFAHYQSFINPFSITLHASIFIVALVVLGGTANLYGTVVGAVLLVGLPEALRFLQADQEIVDALRTLIYGVLLILFMRFRPEGFVPEYTRFGRRPAAPAPGSTSAQAPPVSALEVATARAERAVGELALRAQGLSKNFGGIRAVVGLDLTLPRGRITALVGPNGAGKTTVFNLLTGFLQPDQGSVWLADRQLDREPPWRRVRAGLARSFQDVRLFERMTVLDNVLVAIPNQPGENLFHLFFSPRVVAQAERANREKAMAYLRFVGLEAKADELAGSLAYGEQKLVALARLLATEAEVLLLDEPAAGVDLYWVDRILELLRQLTAAGKTICLVEHNLEAVTAVADHACFLDVGRKIAEGTPAQLMADRDLTERYFGMRGATAP
ncbi:MAG TPA: branched-chain amino acid ABC transporter ATP-binding protein/permease, partial [Bacillota bacterium]